MSSPDTAPDEANPSALGDDPPQEVHAAICALIDRLPGIGKDDSGSGLNYNFRGIETIMAFVKEEAPKLGVHWTAHRVKVLSDTTYQAGSTGKTTMRRVVVKVRWRIYGPDGSWIPAASIGEAADTSDKATNKATTAARKLMLLDTLQIADAADPDHERPEGPSTRAAVDRVTAAGLKGAARDEVARARPDVSEADLMAAMIQAWTDADPGRGPWPLDEAEDWRQTVVMLALGKLPAPIDNQGEADHE